VSKVTLPQSLKTIEPYAFYRTRIDSIDIPESVDSIGSYAFASTYLKSVYYNVSESKSGYGIFQDTHYLTEIVFGDKVEAIPAGICSDANSLTSVTFPSQLKKIGGSAFYKTKIKDIVLPETVNYIGGGAFAECDSIKSFTIPNAVTYIGGSAFSGCSSLKEIAIPENVTYIGSDAFSFCDSLSVVNYNAIAVNNTTEGVFRSRRYSPLLNVLVGDKVEVIPGGLLRGANITSISLPPSLKMIGDKAFSYSNLTQIEIPETVDSIGNMAFAYCYHLKSVNVPTNLKSLNETFLYCDSLSTVYYNASNAITILENVNLRYTPFYECEQLKEIVFGESVEKHTPILALELRSSQRIGSKTPCFTERDRQICILGCECRHH